MPSPVLVRLPVPWSCAAFAAFPVTAPSSMVSVVPAGVSKVAPPVPKLNTTWRTEFDPTLSL